MGRLKFPSGTSLSLEKQCHARKVQNVLQFADATNYIQYCVGACLVSLSFSLVSVARFEFTDGLSLPMV